MNDDVTLPELARRVDGVERRQSEFVRREVYEKDVKNLHEDITEIKDGQKWATRLIVGQFLALVIALLIWVIQQVPT